jgi:ferredoxin
MKVTIDRAKCTGHARCAALGPDVYVLDDDGYNAMDGDVEVPTGLEQQARDGADGCPERALTITE